MRKYPHGFTNIEEGQKFVKDLQTLRLVPTTLRSKLQEESNTLERKTPRPKKAPRVIPSAEDILGSI
jgi:hypothetical protein